MKIKEYYHDHEGFIYCATSERDATIIYVVSVDIYDGWYCTCEDYKFRKHKCKHIRNVIQKMGKDHPREYEIYKDMKAFVE